ncbi:PAS domain-containing sensor histidine kinase [Lignipirellula cremea]|uniref:histidine kinase n=1 Tax=Lignipirellula cremea TaxID=2528010 RepID=A0A518E532_9BACT|nr:PAS domain S-box protein [Lignipirellula cremea]QDU99194.1 Non-motile and phage-resistance protein [Lignipirellula cremea]
MSSNGETLEMLARSGAASPNPRTIEEAEAILQQLAGAFLDVGTPGKKNAANPPSSIKTLSTLKEFDPGLRRRIAAVREFQAAYEAVPDALLVVDEDGRITLVNTHLERMFGYPRSELLGQMIEIFVPERFRPNHPDARNAFFREPHVRPMGAGLELYGRHRDGHDIPVEISLSPLGTPSGLMVVATIRDLSKQRRIEAQIRRFEARYRTLVEGLPAVTFMAALDEGLNELYVSPQIETLLGFSQEEWLGNPILWYSQLHPDDRKRWHTEFAVTCSTGKPFNSIYRFYSRAGNVVWVHGEAKVIRDEAGRPLFLQGVAFDITQMKIAEDQLRTLNQTLESRVNERTAELSDANDILHLEIQERQRIEAEVLHIYEDLARAHEEALAANQTKSQFLANMSHELRTPLNAIIGYSELLQLLAARKKDDTYTADLERINKAGKHLLALINDILDISKIEAGKMQLELEIFAVGPLAEEIRETSVPLALKNENELLVKVADNLGVIEADMIRLKQCLLNLLSNACKFTEKGQVTLSVNQVAHGDRDWIEFRVQDSGIGLTDEQSARLFQPFTQADASTTRKFGGTGLGLAITKKLCESMGGQINLESKLGEGSTFTIRLPVYIAPTTAGESISGQ